MGLRTFAAFGFILSVLLFFGTLFIAVSPTGLPKGVGVALITGMMVAFWAAVGAAITFIITRDEPRRS